LSLSFAVAEMLQAVLPVTLEAQEPGTLALPASNAVSSLSCRLRATFDSPFSFF